MCRLFETIKIKDGIAQNLGYHANRMNRSRSRLFGIKSIIDLADRISVPASMERGIFRCRVIYREEIEEIGFEPYAIKPVKYLHIVRDDTIEYGHKYLDRSRLNSLLQGCKADDILIIKNGDVTDTSAANIVFHDGSEWITPSTPLLMGTKREALLDAGLITENHIREQDLGSFQKATLINAMLDLGEGPVIEVSNISS